MIYSLRGRIQAIVNYVQVELIGNDMNSITKNKLKMIALKEIVKNNPNLTVGEFNIILNRKIETYKNILKEI